MIRAVFSILLMVALTACNLVMATPASNPSNNPSNQPTTNPQTQIDAAVSQTSDAQTQVARAVQQTIAALVTATPPMPSDTPLPSFTFTPQAPMVSVSVETNCRSGPGTVFPALGILRVGQTAEVVGRSIYKDNWIIKLPSNPALTCWLWGKYATVVGDVSGLPAITPPPTPTPAIDFTFSYTTMGVGAGYECVIFTAKNTSPVTWESYTLVVNDTNLSVSGTNTSNDFTGYDSFCVLSGTVGSISPFNSFPVYVNINFPSNPAGTYYDATLTMCTADNMAGTCLTRTLSSHFAP
jgi:hypothetical protein